MGNTKIVLNRSGVRELLKSDGIMAACQEAAEGVIRRAGPGYQTNTYTGANRVNVSIYAEDPAVVQDNLDNNTLLKALGGGSG